MDNINYILTLLNSALRVMTPILLVSAGAALCSRVKIFNMALEGMMLIGCFAAILGQYLTNNLITTTLIVILCSTVFSIIIAILLIKYNAPAAITGISGTLLATGLTTFALRSIFNVKGAFYDPSMRGLPRISLGVFSDIPILKDLFKDQTIIVYLSIIIAILMYIYLFKTVSGFHLLSIGKNIEAAISLGIKVKRYQYGAVIVSGILCGIAGMQLSLGQVTMFTEGMSSGRGYMALAANFMGQSHPLGVIAASFMFGLMEALGNFLQNIGVRSQLTMMLPYIATICALAIFKNKDYKRETDSLN